MLGAQKRWLMGFEGSRCSMLGCRLLGIDFGVLGLRVFKVSQGLDTPKNTRDRVVTEMSSLLLAQPRDLNPKP